MNNGTSTLHGGLLLINQLEIATPTTVAGTLYGIAFTLFCLYVHSLVPRLQDEDRKRQAKFMLGYSAVVMLCGLYNLVANTWATQDAFIKHGEYRGGPYIYIVSTFHNPAVAITIFCQVAVDTLTSAIQIWRVWVIWSATRYANLIIVLPSLCFLTFTALNLRVAIIETALSIVELDAETEVAENAIQAVTTILCTTLISLFLVFQQWRQRKLIGQTHRSAGYMKIVAMLIESYALESIWVLIVAVLFHPVKTFFAETKTYIEIIAYLLVQYRVASGEAYGSRRAQSNISSLHWNHSHHATTQLGETSEAGGGPHVSIKPEGSEALPASGMA